MKTNDQRLRVDLLGLRFRIAFSSASTSRSALVFSGSFFSASSFSPQRSPGLRTPGLALSASTSCGWPSFFFVFAGCAGATGSFAGTSPARCFVRGGASWSSWARSFVAVGCVVIMGRGFSRSAACAAASAAAAARRRSSRPARVRSRTRLSAWRALLWRAGSARRPVFRARLKGCGRRGSRRAHGHEDDGDADEDEGDDGEPHAALGRHGGAPRGRPGGRAAGRDGCGSGGGSMHWFRPRGERRSSGDATRIMPRAGERSRDRGTGVFGERYDVVGPPGAGAEAARANRVAQDSSGTAEDRREAHVDRYRN